MQYIMLQSVNIITSLTKIPQNIKQTLAALIDGVRVKTVTFENSLENTRICASTGIRNCISSGQMHSSFCHKILNKLAIALTVCMTLQGCLSTDPSMGGSSGNIVSGGAAGANSANNNTALETCDEPLGTASLFEDRSLPWWGDYRRRYPDLGSTIPVIRTMVQQSNCFVIVERGAAMNAMNRERELMQAGQLREGSNIGGGQMVTADYTVSPSIQFSQKDTGGLKGVAGGIFGSIGSVIGGGLGKNEAATTLLLIDNRSGVQVSSAVGNAANYDFDIFGGFFAGIAGGAKGYSDSPEGKVLMASFADSYNQMVMALRNYKPQQVKGGLGTGGQLKVDGAVQATNDATIVSGPNQNRPAVILSTHTTTNAKTMNPRINEYDERALQNYYDMLKEFSSSLSGISEMASGEDVDPKVKSTLRIAVNMFVGRLETSQIELAVWPYQAKVEGWNTLGARIEQYNTIFNRNRDNALKSGVLDDDMASLLSGVNLITKESLLN